MAWYHLPGPDHDVAVSCQVSFARNLSGIPFTSQMDANTARQLIDQVGNLLCQGGFTAIDFQNISPTSAYAWVEQRYASTAFAKSCLPHVLYINQPCHLSVMVCELDHIRLQCIQPGLSLGVAYEGVSKIEQMLDGQLSFAFNENLGYLSSHPAHVGSGMQASVMLFLPMLCQSGELSAMESGIERLGMVLRGEKRGAPHTAKSLYQISTRPMQGVDEETRIGTLERMTLQLVQRERELRASVKGKAYDLLCDKIYRSLGTLTHAHLLSTAETLSLLGYVRLGVAMGICHSTDIPTLTTLGIETMPATLSTSRQTSPDSQHERQLWRATFVKEKLKSQA